MPGLVHPEPETHTPPPCASGDYNYIWGLPRTVRKKLLDDDDSVCGVAGAVGGGWFAAGGDRSRHTAGAGTSAVCDFGSCRLRGGGKTK